MTMPLRPCASCSKRSGMASRSPAPSLRLIPLNLAIGSLCDRVPLNQVIPQHWGKLRLHDEMSRLSTRQPVMVASSKSVQKTAMDGRNTHRAVRYHDRIGFTRHERELLDIHANHAEAFFSSLRRKCAT